MLQEKGSFNHEEKQKLLDPGQKYAKFWKWQQYLLGQKKSLVADGWSSYENGIPLSAANPAVNYRI